MSFVVFEPVHGVVPEFNVEYAVFRVVGTLSPEQSEESSGYGVIWIEEEGRKGGKIGVGEGEGRRRGEMERGREKLILCFQRSYTNLDWSEVLLQ